MKNQDFNTAFVSLAYIYLWKYNNNTATRANRWIFSFTSLGTKHNIVFQRLITNNHKLLKVELIYQSKYSLLQSQFNVAWTLICVRTTRGKDKSYLIRTQEQTLPRTNPLEFSHSWNLDVGLLQVEINRNLVDGNTLNIY